MALTDALSSIAGTASGWGSTPSLGGGKQQQSQSGAWDAANKAAKRIADAIKASSGDKSADKMDAEMNPVSYKKGGPVKKTGLAKLHKGERVLTVKQAKKYGRKK